MEIIVNKKTRKINDNNRVIEIGNDGENLQDFLIFTFDDEFVNGQARLEYELEDGTKNYIILEKDNESYKMPIKSIITKAGLINMQLVITENEQNEGIPLFKSNKFPVRVHNSINAVEEAPEGYEQWIEVANEKLNEIDNLNIEAEQTQSGATITITKKDGTEESVELTNGENGIPGQDGADGITPTIGNNGNWYLGETDTGKPSRGEQGLQGQPGATGNDGISPTVNIFKNNNTTTIEITDKDGTHTATINDGVNGTNGRDGYRQYTAGDNITIENDVISASGGTTYDEDNKLYADYVDDTTSVNKFVTSAEKTSWNNKADTSDIPTKTSDLINDSNFTSQEVYFNEMITLADTSSIFVFENKKRGIYYFDSSEEVNQFRYKKFNSDSTYSLVNTHPFYLEIYKDFDFDNFEENEYFALLLGEDTYGSINKYKFRKNNNNVVISNAVGVSRGTFLLTKAQTIIGVKTFNSIPQQSSTTAPTLDTQFTNKKYVDDLIGAISGGTDVQIVEANYLTPLKLEGLKKGIYVMQIPGTLYYSFDGSTTYRKDLGGDSRIYGMILFLKNDFEDVTNSYLGDLYSYTLNGRLGRDTLSYDATTKKLNASTGSRSISNRQASFITDGDQYFSGVKTFYSIPQQSNTTAPTQDKEFTNKKYVDDSIASAIGDINTILASMTTPGGGE